MNEKISLGEFLKETRRDRGISIDEIARETNISKRYLEALEANQFDTFPGDTYVTGFLSTYAEALELDKENILSMYRRQMRIEQDAPLEELVGSHKKAAFSINPKMLGIIGGSVFGLFLLIMIISGISRNNNTTPEPLRDPNTFTFLVDNVESITSNLYVSGDIINITNDVKNIQVGISRIGPAKNLEIIINKKKYSLKEGGVLSVDTDNNDINDMSFEVFNFHKNGIKISISLLNEAEVSTPDKSSETFANYKDYILSETELYTVDIKEKAKLTITVEGDLWMEYQEDSNDPKDGPYSKGQTLNLEFNDQLVLLLANAGAAEIKAKDQEEKGGSWGEVNKSVFYWKNNNGKFTLVRAMLK